MATTNTSETSGPSSADQAGHGLLDIIKRVGEQEGELGLKGRGLGAVRKLVEAVQKSKSPKKQGELAVELAEKLERNGTEVAKKIAAEVRAAVGVGAAATDTAATTPPTNAAAPAVDEDAKTFDAGPPLGEVGTIVEVELDRLLEQAPFSTLLPQDPVVRKAIHDSMVERGFDKSCPGYVWRSTLIRGHTRKGAARDAGLKTMPVYIGEFEGLDEAYDFAIRDQVHRRNLGDGSFIHLVEQVDKRFRRGGRPGGAAPETAGGVASSTVTAKLLNSSDTRVEKARVVIDRGDEKIRAAIVAGELSLHKAATELREKAQVGKPGAKQKTKISALKAGATMLGKVLEKIGRYAPDIVGRLQELADQLATLRDQEERALKREKDQRKKKR